MIKALLLALLEPIADMKQTEANGNLTRRLVILEELKTMPFGAVWDYYCQTCDVPVGMAWLDEVTKYEKNVLCKR
jgi:L-rhamnose isomerase